MAVRSLVPTFVFAPPRRCRVAPILVRGRAASSSGLVAVVAAPSAAGSISNANVFFVRQGIRSMGLAYNASQYTPQQMLLLGADFHRAFKAGDKGWMRTLSVSIIDHLHLFRPSEISMVLNHLAHSRVLDTDIWEPISDVLPDLFIDVDAKSVAVAMNAYARASLAHDAALQALISWGKRLSEERAMDGRAGAMLVNGVSRLRVRCPELMEGLVDSFLMDVVSLNEIDLATIANAYARFAMQQPRLFDVLRKPMMHSMRKFSVQNLAMLANAHARLQRRDEELLGVVAAELKRHCDGGKPIRENLLPSIIHAFAVRLSITPLDLIAVVEHSLPRVVSQMLISDLLLTVPPLAQIPGFRATPELRDPVFARVEAVLYELTDNALASMMSAAAKMRHTRPCFWDSCFGACEALFSRSGHQMEGRHIALFSDAVAEAWTRHVPPPFSADMKSRIFCQLAEVACREGMQAFPDVRSLAEFTAALARARYIDPRVVAMIRDRCQVLQSGRIAEADAAEPLAVDHAARLQQALVDLEALKRALPTS
eukprot:TRINITY_DN73772_c0_g1_i1.p1 TRINITY_DN73772_c0_g1~~TRINITY_DN73772_c0_g1_i1.p1  ORF type:complete len:556 (+),score=64.17 TRINITY_DN73772_c0_g1_i1:51-1670(+)